VITLTMSGKRKEIITTGEIYHVFNKSLADAQVFTDTRNLNRLLELADFYKYLQKIRYSFFKRMESNAKLDYIENYRKTKPLVSLYAFSFMPNHFHMLLKQNEDGGIKKFVGNLQNSFAKYHNRKNKRMGSMFLRPFKAKHVGTDEDFLHISRYIHLNPITSYLMGFNELDSDARTSFPQYMKRKKEGGSFVDTEFLLRMVGSASKYSLFVKNQVDYQRKLKKIKHLTFD